MLQGVSGNSNPGIGAVNTPISTGGATDTNGNLSNQKDAKEASTDAKFGEVWKQIQAKYGAKAEKPREIKKSLGKDDFLRIMITQMKHQDPTQPFKAEQFASEMAQFTSVEQLQNLNQSMNKMASQNQPLERLAMTNLIGKTVTVDRERFPHTEGMTASLPYSLPKDASQVRVAIIAENGETILEKDLGPQKTGENSFSWDGLKSTTLPAKTGNYMFRIEAKDDHGQSISTNALGKTKVVGVSFEGNEPVFLVGNINAPDKVSMRNIVRIESEGNNSIPGAQPLSSPMSQNQSEQSQTAAQPAMNLISFKRGEGSSTVSPDQLPPGATDALAKLQSNSVRSQQQAYQQAMAAEEKGFPNGLKEADDSMMTKGGE